MEVIPAIDIRGGKAVRLFQGDYSKETVFNESPLAAAEQWLELGATRLHIVDLDGARSGEMVNIGVIAEIASNSPIPVQLGGGIRELEAARSALDHGIQRVIVGTAALRGQSFVSSLCDELGAERIIIGVEARDGYVAAHGWTETSETSASELVSQIASVGVNRFVYTDISRDGTLTAPNFDSICSLLKSTDLKMLVAGGISKIDHLVQLAEMGIEGSIVGTAVYTGAINLTEALEALGENR